MNAALPPVARPFNTQRGAGSFTGCHQIPRRKAFITETRVHRLGFFSCGLHHRDERRVKEPAPLRPQQQPRIRVPSPNTPYEHHCHGPLASRSCDSTSKLVFETRAAEPRPPREHDDRRQCT
ncbi:hypothetical protein E2C01_008894 [Portunus trituberculatus]|uniref:Uncharacterized protein n=1 Tax=Portunus trituberculatus TaxID=210409 RepID=A0A5B7D444_PORTR|nr:hypothetical protein [Portunus trituberculatus]